MGACGIHPLHEINVIETNEALILNEMIEHACQVIAMADASKRGMISATQVCSSTQTHVNCTDDGADPAVVKEFEQQVERVVAVWLHRRLCWPKGVQTVSVPQFQDLHWLWYRHSH